MKSVSEQKFERAWAGGSFVVVGTGNNKAVRYVCDNCRMLVGSVFEVSSSWICSTCEERRSAQGDHRDSRSGAARNF
jgi:hypothetical protein